MIDKKLSVRKTDEESTIVNNVPEKSRRKKSSYLVVLVLILLTLSFLVYGFAKGYLEVSFGEPETRAENIKKQSERLRSEISEIEKNKEILEQKRDKILEQLKKTKTLVENSKNSYPEVDAHIQVVTDTCKSCRTPAWIESYREAFASLEEIEEILDEDNSIARIK